MGTIISNCFPDPAKLEEGYPGVQVVLLGLAYAVVLFKASNLISDGSELLLLIPSMSGIVGSVVLPILGAVPDGAIVVFSGLGDDAQNQLVVGVGALAGSTIMLLTIPWFLAIISGRVNLENGKGTYHKPPGAPQGWTKLMPPGKWAGTGVTCASSVSRVAVVMLITSISYVIIQGPAFAFKCGLKNQLDGNGCDGKKEKWFALAGMLLALGFFFWYLWDQVKRGGEVVVIDAKTKEMQAKALKEHVLSIDAMWNLMQKQFQTTATGGDYPLLGSHRNSSDTTPDLVQLQSVLRPFFNRYDTNRDGTIDAREFALLLSDIGEHPSDKQFNELLKAIDRDMNGVLDFGEFTDAILYMFRIKSENRDRGLPPKLIEIIPEGAQEDGKEEENEEEEEEEIPDDLAHLSPEEQSRRIKLRALWMLSLGTVVVLIFSDPMVDVLSNIGDRLHISPFYIAFVFAPLASNASEVIATINYAAKKTDKGMTISFSTLLGAAIMNNTFCLAIFLGLVFGKGLVWQFSAETISILVCEVAMCLLAFRTVHPTWTAGIVACIYPVSLALVAILEKIGLD